MCCTDKRQATPNPQTQETRLNRASPFHRHNQSRCQFLLIARKHIKLQTRCGIRTLQLMHNYQPGCQRNLPTR